MNQTERPTWILLWALKTKFLNFYYLINIFFRILNYKSLISGRGRHPGLGPNAPALGIVPEPHSSGPDGRCSRCPLERWFGTTCFIVRSSRKNDESEDRKKQPRYKLKNLRHDEIYMSFFLLFILKKCKLTRPQCQKEMGMGLKRWSFDDEDHLDGQATDTVAKLVTLANIFWFESVATSSCANASRLEGLAKHLRQRGSSLLDFKLSFTT